MKVLKVSLAVIMILAVILSFAACDKDIAGQYAFSSVRYSSGSTSDMSEEDLNSLTVVLFDDGSGVYTYLGEEFYLEYDENCIWEAGSFDAESSYTFKNGKLTIEADGAVWVFKKI